MDKFHINDTLRKSEPFDEENLFGCFSKRKALAKLFSLSDSLRLDLHFLKTFVDERSSRSAIFGTYMQKIWYIHAMKKIG